MGVPPPPSPPPPPGGCVYAHVRPSLYSLPIIGRTASLEKEFLVTQISSEKLLVRFQLFN